MPTCRRCTPAPMAWDRGTCTGGLIAAIENMLPEGERRKFYYLGIDFMREPTDPKDEIRVQKIADSYPRVR